MVLSLSRLQSSFGCLDLQLSKKHTITTIIINSKTKQKKSKPVKPANKINRYIHRKMDDASCTKIRSKYPRYGYCHLVLVTPSRLNHSTVCNVMKPPFNGATYLIKTELNVTSVAQKNTNQKLFDVYMYFDFLVCSIC